MADTLQSLTEQRERLIEKVARGGRGVVEARRRLRAVTNEIFRIGQKRT